MTFNYEQFKADFRAAAKARNIDPARGATEFQTCLIRAEISADLHHSRQRELVRAAAARQAAGGVFFDEGRGFLRDNKSLDEGMIARAESAEWWRYLSADDWKSGGDGSTVERRAFAAIRQAIEAKRPPAPRTTFTLEEMGEALHEVITESPKVIEASAYFGVKDV